jgi:hypothetical protein
MEEIPEDMLGPKMLALRDDRQRRFVWIMSCGETSAAQAAREAGYSDIADGAKVRAHGLMHNATVLDAIEECSRKVLRGLAPLAIKAAKDILDDPKHFSHAKMIEIVLDRTGHFAKVEHEHKHDLKITVDTSELEALARRLAQESGIPVQRLLGGYAAGTDKVIEGTATEVRDGRDDVSGAAGGMVDAGKSRDGTV